MQAPTYYVEGYQTFTSPQQQQQHNHIPGQQQFEASPFGDFEQMHSYRQAGGYDDYNSNQMMMQNFHDDHSLGGQLHHQHQQVYNNHPQQPVMNDIYDGHSGPVIYQDAAFDPNAGSVIPQSIPMMNFQNDMSNQHTHSQFDSFPMISTDYSSDQQAYITPPLPTEPIQHKNYTITGAPSQHQFQSHISNTMASISGFPTIDTFSTVPISPIETPLPSPTSSNMEGSQISDVNSSHTQLTTPVSPKKPNLARHYSSPRTSVSSSRRSSVPNSKISKPPVKRNSTSPNLAASMRSSGQTQHTTQPGPIPATKPTITKDPATGEELLMFSYSKRKIIKNFTIKCPAVRQKFEEFLSTLPQEFLLENCVYPRAMKTEEEYKGNRYNYEKECNEIGWNLAWLNPEIRDHRGLIQRAVDSWRNTRPDKKLRSRRVRKSELTTN